MIPQAVQYAAMSKRHKTEPQPYTGPMYPLGSTVVIKRPNLWSGCAGEVVAVYYDVGIHRIKIPGKHGGHFHADASGLELEPDV